MYSPGVSKNLLWGKLCTKCYIQCCAVATNVPQHMQTNAYDVYYTQPMMQIYHAPLINPPYQSPTLITHLEYTFPQKGGTVFQVI